MRSIDVDVAVAASQTKQQHTISSIMRELDRLEDSWRQLRQTMFETRVSARRLRAAVFALQDGAR